MTGAQRMGRCALADTRTLPRQGSRPTYNKLAVRGPIRSSRAGADDGVTKGGAGQAGARHGQYAASWLQPGQDRRSSRVVEVRGTSTVRGIEPAHPAPNHEEPIDSPLRERAREHIRDHVRAEAARIERLSRVREFVLREPLIITNAGS